VRDGQFDARPEVAVAGAGAVDPREDDFTRCTAEVHPLTGDPEDD
jgi:hypothetical protein